MTISSRKELEIILSSLKDFSNPKEILEQWMTPPDVAASMIWSAQEDLRNRLVADFGAGTGILGIGALLIGAKKVYFVEIDKEALKICESNIKLIEEMLEIEFNYELINDDVRNFSYTIDTVIMNPPWGLEKRRHLDRVFILTAFKNAEVVYTLIHYSKESLSFFEKLAKKHSFSMETIALVRFPLKFQYKHHRRPIKYVSASFICFRKKTCC